MKRQVLGSQIKLLSDEGSGHKYAVWFILQEKGNSWSSQTVCVQNLGSS